MILSILETQGTPVKLSIAKLVSKLVGAISPQANKSLRLKVFAALYIIFTSYVEKLSKVKAGVWSIQRI
jgi:hypothetical protein